MTKFGKNSVKTRVRMIVLSDYCIGW